MSSDIKLEGETVIAQGRTLKAAVTDFILDHPERRLMAGANDTRRALVHDFNDSLTINFGGDYPNGVNIRGVLTINELRGAKTNAIMCRAHDLMLDSAERRIVKPGVPLGQRRALVHDFNDALTVNFGGDYPGGVNIRGAVRLDELHIDRPERRVKRPGMPDGPRRALVHDVGDALTVNFNGDYPGGVNVRGALRVDELRGAKTNAVVCRATDLILDSDDRRKTPIVAGMTPEELNKKKLEGVRRALVHDHGDALTVNFAGDYPGGVRINGRVTLPGGLSAEGKNARILIEGGDIVLTTKNLKMFDASLEVKGDRPPPLGQPKETAKFNLVEIIRILTVKVASLEAKVAALEKKVKP